MRLSHHLLLHAAGWLCAFHHVATLVGVAHVGQAERTTTVLVALELGDGLSSVLLLRELDDTSTAGATSWLVLNLSTLDLTDRDEEFDEILVARAPREL